MKKINLADARRKYNYANGRILFISNEILTFGKGLPPEQEFKDALATLCDDHRNSVVLISSMSTSQFDERVPDLPITLVAEDGGFVKSHDGHWQIYGDLFFLWRQPIIKMLQRLQDRYQDTSIEEKHFSVTWHYENGPAKISEQEKNQLAVAFRVLANQYDVPMIDNGHSVKFHAAGISRGKFASSWMNNHGYADFVLAVGDKRDENLFESIDHSCLTVRLAYTDKSAAAYYVESKEDLLRLLLNFTNREP